MFIPFAYAQAQEQQDVPPQKDWINILEPAEDTEVVSKKPEVRAEFTGAIIQDSLVVLVDGTDVTQLITITDNGFVYNPVMVLPPGSHSVSISAADEEGRQLQKDMSFTTRHTVLFEEAYTDNEVSAIYETIISDPDRHADVPDSKIEGNLRSDTKIKEQEWEFNFNTNVRYFDQNRSITFPQKGIDIANWIFDASYTKDMLALKASIGDVQINESQYTVSGLSRKGGVFSLQYDNFKFSTFSVQSEQFYGLKGIGIEGSLDDHIVGASADMSFFDRRLEIKTIYATGGEPTQSWGISTSPGVKQGDVLGFVVASDFFESKMRTEFEMGFSEFDPDTGDEFDETTDNAYKLKIGGNVGRYNYEAMYEYIGPDYAVVGNQMIQKDKEGVSFMNSLSQGYHNFNLMASRYNDNVEGDDLFPRMVNYQGNLTYSFSGIPNFPINVSYQKSVQDSTREPEGMNETNMHMDSVMGGVNFSKDALNLGFQASYSLMNDRTESNYDTTTITYTLTSSYMTTNVSVSPSFSLNQTKMHVTSVWTDTYTMNLDLRSNFFQEKLHCDLGGTYSLTKADDDSVDSGNFNMNFRLAYDFKRLLKGYLHPTIAMRGSYMKYMDNNNPDYDQEDFTLMLVLTTTMPFSF